MALKLADRHVFDHPSAQRAGGLLGHGGAPVLSEVVELLDLRTGPFHPLRLLIIARAPPQPPYRERFSPMTHLRHWPAKFTATHNAAFPGPLWYGVVLG